MHFSAFPASFFSFSSHSSLNSIEGYKMSIVKWRRMYDKFPSNENNRTNRECYVKWKNLQCSVMAASGIDCHLQKQMQSEVERNRALLERLLQVTLHLASRNLPFRGRNTELGNIPNGYFLGTLELLACFDPILKEHLEQMRTSTNSRLTHYTSPRIQN